MGAKRRRKDAKRERRLRLEQLECRWLLATVTWDAGGDGVSWSNPLNWDGDTLPTEQDDVEILFSPFPVTHTTGETHIKSLLSFVPLSLLGGSLTVSEFSAVDNLYVNNASLVVDGPTAFFAVTQEGTLVDATLSVVNGGGISWYPDAVTNLGDANTIRAADAFGRIWLSNVTTFDTSPLETLTVEALDGGFVAFTGTTELVFDGEIDLKSMGFGSVVNIPVVSRLEGTESSKVRIEATAGGVAFLGATTVTGALEVSTGDELGFFISSNVDLRNLKVVEGSLSATALRGGTVDLSALESIQGGASHSIIRVEDQGIVLVGPNLQHLDRVDLTLGFGGMFSAGQLKSYTNGNLRVNAGNADLSGVVDISESQFEVYRGNVQLDNASMIDGAGFKVYSTTLSLPAATSYSNNAGVEPASDRSFEVGPGGELDLSNVTSVNAENLRISGRNGGTLDLSGVTTINGRSVSVSADGDGTVVDLSSLSAMAGVGVSALNGAALTLPVETYELGCCEELVFLSASGNGSRLEFPNLTTITRSDSLAHLTVKSAAGGTVSLPTLNAIANPNDDAMGGVDLQAIGVGSQITVPMLARMDGVDVRAADGAVIRLPAVVTYEQQLLGGSADFLLAIGEGSLLEFPNLTRIVGRTPNPQNLLIVKAASGGTLNFPKLVEIHTLGGVQGEDVMCSDGSLCIQLLQGVSLIAESSGVIHLPTDQPLSVRGSYVYLGGGGEIDGQHLILDERSIFWGEGTITLDMTNSGSLNPSNPPGGLGPGTLTIDGHYAQTESGLFDVDFFGATPEQHDRVVVTGVASFAGTFDVDLHNSFVPTLGESFDVLSASNRNGTFEHVSDLYAGTGTGVVLDPVWTASGLTLNTLTVPEFRRHVIAEDLSGASSAVSADFDGDGEIDIAATAGRGNELVWYEHDLRNATFLKHVIDGSVAGPESIQAADFDNDGDADLLVTASGSTEVIWWENGPDGFISKHIIDSSFAGAKVVFVGDLDQDADTDIVFVATESDTLGWWENDGSGSFFKHLIDESFEGASGVTISDLDIDGDYDIVATSGGELA